MAEAISNTSPLLYLHQLRVLDWLSVLFGEVWIPRAVVEELNAGRDHGYDVPVVAEQPFLRVVNARLTPSEWLALDLGPGELAAMALALENPGRIVLLDDALARRTAIAAGLTVWGTLRVLLEAKARGLTPRMEPILTQLTQLGMWISIDLRRRVLSLAGE